MKAWHLPIIALASACVLEPPEAMDAGGSGDGPSTSISGTSASTGSGSGGTVGDDTTAADESADTGTSTTGEDTSSGDTTDGEPMSVCEPQPTEVPATMTFDHSDEVVDVPVVLDVACTVSAITPHGTFNEISLMCEDAPHVLQIADLGPLDLAVDDAVMLHVHDYQPQQHHVHVLLLRDGEVIVAGMRSHRIPEGPGTPEEPPQIFFDPLQIEHVTDVCDVEPLPDEECTGFVCDRPCYQEQREALRFSSGGASVDIFDRTQGTLGDLQIAVSAARHHAQVLCLHTPAAWYSFVATRTL